MRSSWQLSKNLPTKDTGASTFTLEIIMGMPKLTEVMEDSVCCTLHVERFRIALMLVAFSTSLFGSLWLSIY